MTGWNTRKVFWTETSVNKAEGGFSVLLDGRVLKTPAKSELLLPTQAMAQTIADEWAAQKDQIDPLSMPATRAANAAIDKVRVQHAEVADMLAEYGGTDLLCYRATSPERLVALQAAAWDPLLEWAADVLGARLTVASGIMHQPQSDSSLRSLSAKVNAMDAFELAAFHDLVSLSGSLVIGFAVALGRLDAAEGWKVSQIDEDWQEELWGTDEEASQSTKQRKSAFFAAKRFFDLAQKPN